jgi:hypothetical protein
MIPTAIVVKPISFDVNPTQFDVTPTTFGVNPTTFHVCPTTSDVNPTTFDVNPTTLCVNPTAFDAKPTVDDPRIMFLSQSGPTMSLSFTVNNLVACNNLWQMTRHMYIKGIQEGMEKKRDNAALEEQRKAAAYVIRVRAEVAREKEFATVVGWKENENEEVLFHIVGGPIGGQKTNERTLRKIE